MTTWKTVRNELNLTGEDERLIELEKEIIRSVIEIRESKGLTQVQLAETCGVQQPAIARIEKSTQSPRINSLLKILVPLGYTLQIVPLKNKQ